MRDKTAGKAFGEAPLPRPTLPEYDGQHLHSMEQNPEATVMEQEDQRLGTPRAGRALGNCAGSLAQGTSPGQEPTCRRMLGLGEDPTATPRPLRSQMVSPPSNPGRAVSNSGFTWKETVLLS